MKDVDDEDEVADEENERNGDVVGGFIGKTVVKENLARVLFCFCCSHKRACI